MKKINEILLDLRLKYYSFRISILESRIDEFNRLYKLSVISTLCYKKHVKLYSDKILALTRLQSWILTM